MKEAGAKKEEKPIEEEERNQEHVWRPLDVRLELKKKRKKRVEGSGKRWGATWKLGLVL